MPILAIAHIFEILVLGAAFAGPIATYGRDHPGPGCVNKRDLITQVARADVGPCNVPQYNFDICRDQIKGQVASGVKVMTSMPSSGGKFASPHHRLRSATREVEGTNAPRSSSRPIRQCPAGLHEPGRRPVRLLHR